ncbi:reverse transcriptase domain-containing protein [Tanacetum coccineum]|uniref:Reverse transcriptase domain-containing protein n=1 Tax=Tanacetum coccineum TaxID=301880 RepID=A0ABQ4XZ57_9ASTR
MTSPARGGAPKGQDDREIEDQDPKEDRIVKGKEIDDEDLRDHLNRFVGVADSGEWPMPVWCRMFQQTLNGSARGWFESLSPNNIDEWWKLREAFTTRYSTRKACYKEPHEITKIVRKANETLTAFKERWTVENNSSLVLAPRNEFVRDEEAYALVELPPGESRDIHRQLSFPAGSRDVHQRLTFKASRRDDQDEEERKDTRIAGALGYTPPISFPPIDEDDAIKRAMIRESIGGGYLVRRVYVDEGSSVEVMFEHCFEKLPEKVRARLRETRTDLVGFAGKVAKPLGKINLEVRFGNEGVRETDDKEKKRPKRKRAVDVTSR